MSDGTPTALQEMYLMRLFTASFRYFPAVVLVMAAFPISHHLAGQQAQPEVYQSQTTLRSNSRLVVVDVVATDSKGQPVTGLNGEDFTVLENGVPQKISTFTFQHPGEAPAPESRSLPPNIVTNAPWFKSGALDVILFDSVNGEFAAQSYAKAQLAKFFSNTTLDRPVALFVLETRVRLLQDFTTDAATLRAAIEKYKPIVQGANTESFESRESPFTTYGDYHTNDRNIETTLNQLHALAKILGGYPGRKNLIWLSESFPVVLFPEQVLTGNPILNLPRGSDKPSPGGGQSPSTITDLTRAGGGTLKDYAELVKKVADAMMTAQVAVYPVDAAGVGKNDHLASQHTANDLAERTGGKAFHNTNDLTGSMRASVEDGSTYYTLAYYPENKKWDGQFRVIQIKANRPDITLRYRLGYYALDPEKAAKDDAARVTEDFSRSLQVDSPAATAVRFQAGVMPPSTQTKNKVVVNFAVDPHTLHFDRSADGTEHASLSCTVWAFGKDKDKPIMSHGDTSKADLKPEVYEQLMKQYYPCKQELDLKPGTYTLRLGVLDRNSNLMGTTTASVTVQ
jgi:VWFA-related protein